jgi:hypothetical protein
MTLQHNILSKVTNYTLISLSVEICEPESVACFLNEIFEGTYLIGTSLMGKYTDDIKRFWQAQEHIYVECGPHILSVKCKSGLSTRSPLARFF